MTTININTATKEQLVTIKEIGEKRAALIIQDRNKAPLTLESLKLIPGIPNHIWDPLFMSKRITFDITEEEAGEEHLRKMVEKLKTENVILTQSEITNAMELKKLKIDSGTKVESLETELKKLIKQNELLTAKVHENETVIETVTKKAAQIEINQQQIMKEEIQKQKTSMRQRQITLCNKMMNLRRKGDR